MLRTVLYIILGYLAIVALVFMAQRRLLYLPGGGRLPEVVLKAEGLASWPATNEAYRGFVSTGGEEAPRGTVIVFHGNAGSAGDRSYYVQALGPLGYRVLLAEYPGYGKRPGERSEKAFVEDAKETVQLARAAFREPVYLWGESLGAGVAAAVASDASVPVDGLVLLTPWDSLPDLAQSIYWFLPARWLVRDRYDSVKNLQAFNGKVAVVLAERDEVIPKRHGMRLYESVQTTKKLWVFEQAGHNSWPVWPDAPWWKEVMAFVEDDATAPR